MSDVPDGLGKALIGAVIAALGYVAKLATDGIIGWNTLRRARRAKLVELQSLLLVSRRVYQIQNELVQRLYKEIGAEHGHIQGTYDDVLAEAHPLLDEKQRLMHGLIRNYTIHCIMPLNARMTEWLAGDTYFKGAGRQGSAMDLSVALQRLEAHLILWRAKYEFWIPNRPERAIVYMVDENKHGVGFPKRIEAVIARVTGWAEDSQIS